MKQEGSSRSRPSILIRNANPSTTLRRRTSAKLHLGAFERCEPNAKDLDQVCDLLDREVKLQTLIVQSLAADFATRVPTTIRLCCRNIFSGGTARRVTAKQNRSKNDLRSTGPQKPDSKTALCEAWKVKRTSNRLGELAIARAIKSRDDQSISHREWRLGRTNIYQ